MAMINRKGVPIEHEAHYTREGHSPNVYLQLDSTKLKIRAVQLGGLDNGETRVLAYT